MVQKDIRYDHVDSQNITHVSNKIFKHGDKVGELKTKAQRTTLANTLRRMMISQWKCY